MVKSMAKETQFEFFIMGTDTMMHYRVLALHSQCGKILTSSLYMLPCETEFSKCILNF